ncbi:MAG: hypothetical protein CSA62_01600 [Planctomycetota bacterium]|nr:MAG: hypothetical protein CSA62_01600 [Planctomycetota bacterium]
MDNAAHFQVIGLTCNLVGIFLLANSIVFRSPRHLIEEFFGAKTGSLRPLRDYVVNKIQVVIGFLLLTAGFILQALAAWASIDKPVVILVICGVLLLLAFSIYYFGDKYSRRSFRRYLKDFFRRHPYNFAQNIEMTKQIGQLFDVPSDSEETVEAYVVKVMRALGLDPLNPPKGDEESQRRRRLREMAPQMPGKP